MPPDIVPGLAVDGFEWGARTANIIAALWPNPPPGTR